MRFGHIELFVRNPAESRDFYVDVLGFTVEAVQAGGKLIWLRLGDTEVLLRPGRSRTDAQSYSESGTALVLYTDDVEVTTARLQSRGLVFQGDDGAGCPIFTDPDGHWFQLVNPEWA